MANTYSNIDQAYILPSTGLNDAQKLSFLQNKQQLDEQKAQRLFDKQQSQRNFNSNLIDNEFANEAKIVAGIPDIEQIGNEKLDELKRAYEDNHLDDDPASLRVSIGRQVQGIHNWLLKAKEGYTGVTQAASDFKSVFPQSDPAKVRNFLLQKYSGTLTNPDGSLKNADDIHLPDYNSLLTNDDNLGQFSTGSDSIKNYFNAIPLRTFTNKDLHDDQGNVSKRDWSVPFSEHFQEIGSDSNGDPAVRVKSVEIPGILNEPIKVLPKPLFDEVTAGQRKMDYKAMWDAQKPEIQAQYKKDNDGKEMDKRAENYMFNNMVYNDVASRFPTKVSFATANKTPRPRSSGGTNPNGGQVFDAYGYVVKVIGGKSTPTKMTKIDGDIAKKIANNASEGSERVNLGLIFKDGNIIVVNTQQNNAELARYSQRAFNSLINNDVTSKKIINKEQQNTPTPKPDAPKNKPKSTGMN